MDFFSTVNWGLFGAVVSLGLLAVFGWAVTRRQWSWPALAVGLLQLPIVLSHCVAPFRGALDPAYVGYKFGLIHAAPGVEVALFAGVMLLAGLASACLVVLNRPGPRMALVAAYDGWLLLFLLPANLHAMLSQGLSAYRFELGEYVQYAGLPAMLIEVGLLLIPPAIGLAWAVRRLEKRAN